jgi:hypothetical protein
VVVLSDGRRLRCPPLRPRRARASLAAGADVVNAIS